MRAIVAVLLLSLVGCPSAPVGVKDPSRLEPSSAQQCSALCGQIGLTLDSVVIMAENVGCVCSVAKPPAPGTPATARAGGSGGMAAILIRRSFAAAGVVLLPVPRP